MAQDVDRSSELSENVHGSNMRSQKQKMHWGIIFLMSCLHLCFIPGIYLAFTKAAWQTNLFAAVLYVVSKIGTTAGVHRLWSHRSYKANLPLRALLMFLVMLANEGPVCRWVRTHRAHHKYQDTDADPHNAARGLWFSHVGWMLEGMHPEYAEKIKTIDISDLDSDSVVMFQKRYFLPLMIVVTFFLPSATPVYFWDESLFVAIMVAVVVRLILGHHSTWSVNSIAHTYGQKPYDKNIWATENRLSTYVTLGEGWHNYHHAFPWDYRASEMGFKSFNISKAFIDLFAKIGWAYDLKMASWELIEKRALRTGDGTRTASGEPEVWGWNDPDLSSEQRRAATIIRCKND